MVLLCYDRNISIDATYILKHAKKNENMDIKIVKNPKHFKDKLNEKNIYHHTDDDFKIKK
jgi:hypothetical protein